MASLPEALTQGIEHHHSATNQFLKGNVLPWKEMCLRRDDVARNIIDSPSFPWQAHLAAREHPPSQLAFPGGAASAMRLNIPRNTIS